MGESDSTICFIRYNYKLVSSVICIIYLVVSSICMVMLALNIPNGYPLQFLCKFITGGFKTSIGIFISSVLALLGLFLNSPLLMVPLMLMHIIVFAMMKLLFCDLVMETLHGPGASMLWAIFLCISFVVLSILLGVVLWLIYCTFIQLSLTIWPDSPISCRKGRRRVSSTTSTTQRNRRTVVVIL